MSEKIREEFESWASAYRDRNGLPHFTLRKPDGSYVDGTTELCWRGWQASRESLVIELPEPRPVRGYSESVADAMGFNDALESCRDAVEQAGLKVKS